MRDAVIKAMERVVKWQARIAAQSEYVSDSVTLEHSNSRFRARELIHGIFLCLRCCIQHIIQPVACKDRPWALGRPLAILQRPVMSLRIPQTLSGSQNLETGWSELDFDIAQQKAQTLGTLGTQVEQALARLRAFDAGAHAPLRGTERSSLLDDAAERVWAFMIQRELCGLRYWEAVVKDYGITREVLNRLGKVTRKR
jgi:hypothetical protein